MNPLKGGWSGHETLIWDIEPGVILIKDLNTDKFHYSIKFSEHNHEASKDFDSEEKCRIAMQKAIEKTKKQRKGKIINWKTFEGWS